VQPLVRDAAMRGLSVTEVTVTLRATHGHAYRRADMLADLRAYRSAAQTPRHETDLMSTAVPMGQTVPRYVDLGRTIARAGVAVFAITLLAPTLLFGAVRATGNVLVADATEVRAGRAEFSLPNQVAVQPRTIAKAAPTPSPTPEPVVAHPPAALPRVPAPAAQAVAPAVSAGGPGVMVTASWYGPGFFENRLPCWQWLQANGLPIQFLPDTWGVAHKTLPCGTMLVLTHGANTITVPVVDRGPYIAGRELDLSPRIKAALGCTDLCTVLMQIR
jgi:hypothetical protein